MGLPNLGHNRMKLRGSFCVPELAIARMSRLLCHLSLSCFPLSPDVHSCPHAVNLLEGRDRDLPSHVEDRTARSDVQFWGLEDNEGPVMPYLNVRLKSNTSLCITFVRELVERGVARWCRYAAERTALFFVKKKDGRQRLAVDARRANRRFVDPPSVSLATRSLRRARGG